jgi:hypothetical protein
VILKIIVLVGLIRLLVATEKPILCSGIYTGIAFFFGLIMGNPFWSVLFSSAIGFALASLYFWLLDQIQDGALWWIVLIGGLAIGLV